MTTPDQHEQLGQPSGAGTSEGDEFGFGSPEFEQQLLAQQNSAPVDTPAPSPTKPEEDIYKAVSGAGFTSDRKVAVKIERPMVSDRQTPAYEVVDTASARAEHTAGMVASFPNMKEDRAHPDLAWASSAMGGMMTLPLNNQYEAALSREDSDWRQGLADNGDMIRSRIPTLPAQKNAKLTGDAAVQRAAAFLGLGDIYTSAMWNSGFWVTFKPAPDTAWMELNRLLGSEEIRLGRQTYGLIHSGLTALTQQTVIAFLLKYVYATSVDPTEMPISSIPLYLSVHDIPNFIMGFIAANFPHGYTITRSCITDPKVCRYTHEETLDVTEMQIVDNAQLSSPELRAHMRRRAMGGTKLAEVLKYQETLPANTSSVQELKSGSGKTIRVRLAPPSAEREFEAAHAHVDEVVTGVQRTVQADTSVRRRTAMMNEAFASSELRTYEHWVKDFEIDTNTIEDEEDIAQSLGFFSRDHTLRDSFYKAVSAYIDKSVVSLQCLTPLVCPKCGANHQNKSEHLSAEFSDVIPIDVIQVFSLLAEYKKRLILSRLGDE